MFVVIPVGAGKHFYGPAIHGDRAEDEIQTCDEA